MAPRPFDRDLDGRTGFAERIRYTIPERGHDPVCPPRQTAASATLYRDQYAWADAIQSRQRGGRLAGLDRPRRRKYMKGNTGMGFRGRGRGPGCKPISTATYALLSHKYGRSRVTARLDQFATFERDHSISENNNTEHGRAWTLAWLYDVTPHWAPRRRFSPA